jgi:hypothetical protein
MSGTSSSNVAPLPVDPETGVITVPVFDTADPATVAAIAALPVVAEPGSNDLHPREAFSELFASGGLHDRIEARRIREWQNNAGVFARAGIRPGPAHFRGLDGSAHSDLNEGFLDAELYRDELVAAGFLRDDHPLVMLVHEVRSHVRAEQLPWLHPGIGWVAVTHQTAGMACHHANFVGTPIRLHDTGAAIARELSLFSDLGFPEGHSCIGIGGVLLEELSRYRQVCDTLGVRAERAWKILEEAISPLDATDVNLETLGDIPGFDGEIDEITRTGEQTGHLVFFADGWKLVVFGPNCD